MPNWRLPFEEQKAICRFIEEQTTTPNITISRFEHEIGLLREYRTRLVTDVVTGKLDVCEVAAGLPNEAVPEDRPADDGDLIDEDDTAEVEAAA